MQIQKGGVMESIPLDTLSDEQENSDDQNVPTVIDNVPSD